MGRVLAAAIVTATATVFPRIGVITALVEPALSRAHRGAAGPHGTVRLRACLLAVEGLGRPHGIRRIDAENPFNLRIALQFGALLAFIALCARALRAWLGDRGLYLLSAVSGLSDVDAITLSVSRLVSQGLEGSVGALSIMIAVMVNTVVKAVIAIYIGGAPSPGE